MEHKLASRANLYRFAHFFNGRRFLDRDLSAKGLQGGGYTYEWKGKSGYWRCPLTTMEKFEEEDRLYYTSSGTPRYKQFLDEMTAAIVALFLVFFIHFSFITQKN